LSDWSAFEQSCYKCFDIEKTKDAARDFCINEQANLTSVQSGAENVFINSLVGPGSTAPVGLLQIDGRTYGSQVWSENLAASMAPRYFVCEKPIPDNVTTNNTTPSPAPSQPINNTTPPTPPGQPTNDTAPDVKAKSAQIAQDYANMEDYSHYSQGEDYHLRLICQTLINPALNPLCAMLPNDYNQDYQVSQDYAYGPYGVQTSGGEMFLR